MDDRLIFLREALTLNETYSLLTRPVKNYIRRTNTDSNFALFFKEFKKTFTKANTDSTDRAPIQKFTENKIV